MGSASGRVTQQEHIETMQNGNIKMDDEHSLDLSRRNSHISDFNLQQKTFDEERYEENTSVVSLTRRTSNGVVNTGKISLNNHETSESVARTDEEGQVPMDTREDGNQSATDFMESYEKAEEKHSDKVKMSKVDNLGRLLMKNRSFSKARTNENSYTNVKCGFCFLCKNQFKDPRFLPCYHTFCCKCLNDHVMSNYDDQRIKCPLCSSVVSVEETGAKGFEKNILQNSKTLSKPDCDACNTRGVGVVLCKNCQQTLCKKCDALHSEDDATRKHSKNCIREISKDGFSFCNLHPNKEIILFCITCQTAICEICNMTKHKSHEAQDIESIVSNVKQSLKQTLQQPDCLKNIQDAEQQLEKEFSALKAQEDEALSGIEHQNINVMKLIQQKKAELKTEVLAATSYSNKNLQTTAQEIDNLKFSVYNRFHFAEKLLNNKNKVYVATHGAKLMDCIKDYSKVCVSVDVPGTVGFRANKVNVPDIEKLFGNVYPCARSPREENDTDIFKMSDTFSCSLGSCIVTGLFPMPDDTVWVCAGNDGVIEHLDQMGGILKRIDIGYPVDDITGCDEGKVFISCNARKEILYINIKGVVKTFIQTVYCPRGLAIDEEGNCLVGLTEKPVFFDTSTSINGYVSCISTGRQIRTYLASKSIQYPGRIAINNDQSVVISDWIKMAVFVFKDQEEVGCYKGNLSIGPDFIPRDVCCTPKGNVVVVDIASNCLHLLSPDASFIRIISELEIFEEPWSVSFDIKGRLWIGTQNGEIHVANIV